MTKQRWLAKQFERVEKDYQELPRWLRESAQPQASPESQHTPVETETDRPQDVKPPRS